MPDLTEGGTIYTNEVGKLPPLTGPEHLALLTGMSQVARGEEPTPGVASVCILTLARLAGIELPEASGGSPISVGNLPTAPAATVVNLDDLPGTTGGKNTPKPGPHLTPVPKEL